MADHAKTGVADRAVTALGVIRTHYTDLSAALQRISEQVPLDLPEATHAADVISKAGRVDIYGASGSAMVGIQMRLSLTRLGIAAWSWSDVHNGLASAARLRSGDAALGISHSGNTSQTVRMLGMAASRGATTIALTGSAQSPLAGLADIVLLTAAQPATVRPDALSARHTQLAILDLLVIGVAQRFGDGTRNTIVPAGTHARWGSVKSE